MKRIALLILALQVSLLGAQAPAPAPIRHVATSLNHLTVLEFTEPVVTLAVGDAESFQIERHEDKVFIKPLEAGVATNLFVWTASRELSYELDPAGTMASMDVLIRAEPAPLPPATLRSDARVIEDAVRSATSAALIETLVGAEEVVQDAHPAERDGIAVTIEQVYRSGGQIYLRYSVANRTAAPYRLSLPAIFVQTPAATPISLQSLRNHQLVSKTYASFKTRTGAALEVSLMPGLPRDLAPGEQVTGVVHFQARDNQPRLYQVQFGVERNRPVTAEVVL